MPAATAEPDGECSHDYQKKPAKSWMAHRFFSSFRINSFPRGHFDHELHGGPFLGEQILVCLQLEKMLVVKFETGLQDGFVGHREDGDQRPGEIRSVNLVRLVRGRL